MGLFLLIIILLALFFLIIDIIDINRFVVREYNIESEKIDKETRMVVLADMHNRQFGKDNVKLVAAIKKLSPDIICCAGDMLTAHVGETKTPPIRLFEQLGDYPVYYGIGNHEYRLKLYPENYGDGYSEYLNELKARNVHILENGSMDIPDRNITIKGFLMEKKYYMRFEKHEMPVEYVEQNTGSFDENRYEVLIAHDPYYFDVYAKTGADLVLSGHVHGGIMRLPYFGGVISPRLQLFPKYDGGEFKKNNTTMILSRGLGCHTLPLRIFNPGELVCITLSPCKK